jgi:hypothetical protein
MFGVVCCGLPVFGLFGLSLGMTPNPSPLGFLAFHVQKMACSELREGKVVTLGQQRQLDDVAAGRCTLCRKNPAVPDDRHCVACLEALDQEIAAWDLFRPQYAADPPMMLEQGRRAYRARCAANPGYREKIEAAVRDERLFYLPALSKGVQ